MGVQVCGRFCFLLIGPLTFKVKPHVSMIVAFESEDEILFLFKVVLT